VTSTAADYTWFSERCPDLAEAFCLTWVRSLPPAEVLRRVGARESSNLTGIGEVYRAWTASGGDELFVAATVVDGWTLAVEPNGFLGVTDDIVVALSHDTRLVSHFRNVNAVSRFCWVEDGDVRLSFDPLFPAYREGSNPDGLVDVMRKVGFDLREDEGRDFERHTEAAFALAAHLTGVQLRPEHLDSASYLCGTAPFPRP
jgi:uncharacterized protein DUF6461